MINSINHQIGVFADHLITVVSTFNDQADRRGLGIHLDATELVSQTTRGRNYQNIRPFFRLDRPGVLYREQILTAVDAIVEIIESPYRLGLILGALQSGKTTTALALQLAGPAIYLITGNQVFPFYLTTSQNSHERQLQIELSHFIGYYGGLDIVRSHSGCRLRNCIPPKRVNPVFEMSPSLDTYREVILNGSVHFHDVYHRAALNDLIHKRVRGQAIGRLAESARRMVSAGFTPLLIVDEPQFGASDRVVKVGGNRTVVSCLLSQIEQRIRATIGTDVDSMIAIGLSATPFETHKLSRVWKVFQRLGQGYRGFNDFGGQRIDRSVIILPPDTLSMSVAATRFGISFLPMVNSSAYSKARSFFSWARRTGYIGSWNDYRNDCVDAVRSLILTLIRQTNNSLGPIGICLRAINDNDRTEDLLNDLQLPSSRIEVIRFFGNSGKGMTVKQAIDRRLFPSRPYLFMVTSKARMGDQFPSTVRYFIDFSQRASDLNSLLQGLVGRACGYGKQSSVLLSDHNQNVIDAFVSSGGSYVITPSRHSVVSGGGSRIEQRHQITIERDPSDHVLEEYFQALDSQVVVPMVPKTARLRPVRAGKGGRRGPVLTLAEQHMLFAHIESDGFRRNQLPHFIGNPEILRRGERLTFTDPAGVPTAHTYLTDNQGNCRFNFRRDQYAGRGGVRGRGRGVRDARDRSLNAGVLEPSIGVGKFDSSTNTPIVDPSLPGSWHAVSVTLPLRRSCVMLRNSVNGRISLPSPRCVYDKRMTRQERLQRR